MLGLRFGARHARIFSGLVLAGLLLVALLNARFNTPTTAQQSTVVTPDITVIPPGDAYRQTNFISDVGGVAAIQDPLLVNPWGIALTTTFGFAVTNNGTSTATQYNGDVSGSPLVKSGAGLTIPGNAPTGAVTNATDFAIGGGPSPLLFASRTGNITGLPGVILCPPESAVNAVSRPGDVYTGLVIGNSAGFNFLYVANFAAPTLAGSIETFNGAFTLQSVASFPFNDTAVPAIPADFRPFNIINIGGSLFVSYARAGAGGVVQTGAGLGFVSKFSTSGAFLGRVISNGALDAPWGMALANASFGTFAGAFLVGNFGDGRINAYNATTGVFLGTLKNEAGDPIVISGLRALAFGNGGAGPDPGSLYFVAGIGQESRGLFGSLKPTTASATSLIQFASDTFTIGEGGGHIDITVTRAGDVSASATVNYATFDTNAAGFASQKSDYEMAAGKLTFNPGETSKTFSVLIVDDNLVEGGEKVNLALSNPTGTGVGLGSPNQATLTITDNDSTPSTANPIDDASFFVRQQYLDFLNREPDPPGFSFWTSQITSCGSDADCIAVKRINVSAAYFLSIEFQNTGMIAYLANKAAFVDRGVVAVPVLYGQFERNTQALQKGFVFGAPGADAVIEANKVAYFNDFVTRPEFVAKYPASVTPADYVDRLMDAAGFSTDKTYRAALNGGQPVPPNASPANAFALIGLNAAETQIGVTWFAPSGLSSALTAVHVHGPAAPGVNGPILFTLPNDSASTAPGSCPVRLTITNFDVTPAQVADLKAGRWYFDIHSTSFPDGEIRGQFPASAQAFRDSLVSGLSASPATETRATVLRKIAESAEFRNREFNYAFVLMQYLGYLRRDPDTAGYNFWLGKLNLFSGNFITAEMVKAFITSSEYRQRFGP